MKSAVGQRTREDALLAAQVAITRVLVEAVDAENGLRRMPWRHL